MKVDELKARCMECGDCWIWMGDKNKDGLPMIGKTSARRAMYEAAKEPLETHELVAVSCEKADCLAPAHLVKTKRSRGTKKAAAINQTV